MEFKNINCHSGLFTYNYLGMNTSISCCQRFSSKELSISVEFTYESVSIHNGCILPCYFELKTLFFFIKLSNNVGSYVSSVRPRKIWQGTGRYFVDRTFWVFTNIEIHCPGYCDFQIWVLPMALNLVVNSCAVESFDLDHHPFGMLYNFDDGQVGYRSH